MEDLTARKLFKAQIRKELLDELGTYGAGWAKDGKIIAMEKATAGRQER